MDSDFPFEEESRSRAISGADVQRDSFAGVRHMSAPADSCERPDITRSNIFRSMLMEGAGEGFENILRSRRKKERWYAFVCHEQKHK